MKKTAIKAIAYAVVTVMLLTLVPAAAVLQIGLRLIGAVIEAALDVKDGAVELYTTVYEL